MKCNPHYLYMKKKENFMFDTNGVRFMFFDLMFPKYFFH